MRTSDEDCSYIRSIHMEGPSIVMLDKSEKEAMSKDYHCDLTEAER